MRQKSPRPKAQQTVPIPADLASFLAEVHQQILDGDPATLHECDDCLQCASAYGGLAEEGGSVFGFTYFPGAGIDTKWELLLDKADIEQIANGQQKELALWTCQVAGCGNTFSDERGLCFYHDYAD